MAKDEKLRVSMYLSGFLTFLSFAVLLGSSKNTGTSFRDPYGLNYTSPILQRCPVIQHPNGTMIQTIPKLFSFLTVVGQIPGLARRQIICRLPDCVRNLCKNGWCEETVGGFKCHCSTVFQEEQCEEQSVDSVSKETRTTTLEQSETTTSRDPIASGPKESWTTDATTKSTSTTMWEQPETTSQEITTISVCTSSPIEVLNGGSFYNFSTCKMNHSSALSSCSEHDSHLVYIETKSEQNFIKGQIQILDPSVDYWIGLRRQSGGGFRWWNGSRLTYDNNAGPVKLECFVIKTQNTYTWHDRACSNVYKYICEKEIDDNA